MKQTVQMDLRLMGMSALVAALLVSGCAGLKPASSGRQGLISSFGDPAGQVSSARHTPVGKAEKREIISEQAASDPELEKLKPAMAKWNWPLRSVQVNSTFGRRGSEFHEGLDLKAAIGTPVYAVEAAKVIYAGQKIRGYGKLVVLRHPNGLSSVYAHNSRLLVRVGQTVAQGQNIAMSGRSGHASGPHLHFELRKGVAALDPAHLLADPAVARVIPEVSSRLANARGRRSGAYSARIALRATRATRRLANNSVVAQGAPKD